MKQRINAVRVGSSHNTERLAELKANHEELQRMLANGWEITAVKKTKRPRIQKPKTPREVEVSIFGGKVRMTFAEYQQRGQGLKVIMEIF